VSVWVPCIWVRFVWQCLHCCGLCVIVWLGCFVIFSPCPLCFGCAPGFLFVFWRRFVGFFHVLVEGGLWLFWEFLFSWVFRCIIWMSFWVFWFSRCVSCWLMMFCRVCSFCFICWFSVASALFSVSNCFIFCIKFSYCFGILHL